MVKKIFIFIFCLGVFRFHLADISAPHIFESKVGQNISLTGNIVDEPEIKENNQRLIVETAEKESRTKILLSADFAEEFKYGDEISFEGKLKKPENFMTDQGKEFDYVNYLRKDGIFYVMDYPKTLIISRENGNFVKNTLFGTNSMFLSSSPVNSLQRLFYQILFNKEYPIILYKSRATRKSDAVCPGCGHNSTASKPTIFLRWKTRLRNFVT